MTMEEMYPIEEWRMLIHNKKKTSFLKRLKQTCLLLGPGAIGYGIVLLCLISTVALLAMHLYKLGDEMVVDFPDITEDDEEFYRKTHDMTVFLEEWKKHETELKEENEERLRLYSKDLRHNRTVQDEMELLFAGRDTKQPAIADCALILERVKRSLKKCISVDILPEKCADLLRNNLHCDPTYPYRSMNGSCNNLIHPSWGMVGAPFLRLLKPHYDDDVSSLRQSVYGVDLPNDRLLSSQIFDRKIRPEAETTMMFMNYGLLLDHDFLKTLTESKGIQIQCCSPEVIANPKLRHPSCAEISVPSQDLFFGQRNITCMNFYRSIPSIGKCPGRREQANGMTPYLDLSDIYGTIDEESENLRTYEGGKLKHSFIDDTPVLPFNNQSGKTCYTRDEKYKCFKSGDIRVNMHVEIMALHTVWMREHNRIAEDLQKVNPRWSDEKLFQEARRITIAEHQHITYKEFLPNIFGQKFLRKYGLEIRPAKLYNGYDETVQAGVYNAFAAAAFRFGHTLVQSFWEFRGPQYELRSRVPLRELYTNPDVIYKHGMDDITRGMVSQRTYHTDRYTTREVRNRLFQRYYSDSGLDLTLITIRRGRDHGLPSYTKWRKYCGLEEITSWDDMDKVMDKVRVDELREMYMSVHDIDLVAGGLSEHPMEDALVGPTYGCILWRQFKNVRISDRFWFENRNQLGSFTPDQLAEIYKSNFARILCDTSDSIDKMQWFPFRISSPKNPLVPCSSLPVVDLSHWADSKTS